ncbi:MAG TPA: hypothetical protein VM711_01740, partial [Sphingomicrobium sp.]|nr:hypothetical protein [Sphingomicrobium sp.]
DLTQLDVDTSTQIDAGVTSGADPSSWDTIEVESPNKGCASEGGKSQGAKGSAPAICQAQGQQK